MNNLPGYEKAQREWERMEPPDGGPCDCYKCNGNGEMENPADPEGEYITCDVCTGFGQLTPDGEPFDSGRKEREECEYADMKRADLPLPPAPQEEKE